MAKKQKANLKVLERIFEEPHQFDFFQAAWLLERKYGDTTLKDLYADREAHPVWFEPFSGLVFPPSDIRAIQKIEMGGQERGLMILTFMGLYGVGSPLPVYFYDDIATEKEEYQPLKKFLDLFNHRFYQHFYRAWKKYQPMLQAEGKGVDKHAERFFSLTGLGQPLDEQHSFFSPMRLAAFAGRLLSPTRNAEGLRAILETFFEGVQVRVEENLPRWVEVQERPIMSRKSRMGMVLGDNITLGKKLFDLSGKFRIVMKLATYKQYVGLLPSGEYEGLMRYLVGLYAPDGLSYDVQLELEANKLPRQYIGQGKGFKLGRTGILGHAGTALHKRVVQYF